jgi:hypothetical protein
LLTKISIIDRYENEIQTADSLQDSECILNNTLDNLTSLGLIDGNEVKGSIKTTKRIYEKIGYTLDRQSTIETDVNINYLTFIALRANSAYFFPSYVLILYYYLSNLDYYQEHHPIFSKICDSILVILLTLVGYFYEKFGGGYAAVLSIMLAWFF